MNAVYGTGKAMAALPTFTASLRDVLTPTAAPAVKREQRDTLAATSKLIRASNTATQCEGFDAMRN